MQVLIIEDELPAANRLTEMLGSYDSSIEILDVLDSNKQVKAWAQQGLQPDLIFSDIELLDGQVFDALATVSFQAPIIFTTAYEEYTLNAFDTNGISYLLKPFDMADIDKAIQKYKRLIGSNGLSDPEILAILKAAFNKEVKAYKTRLAVKSGKGIYLLDVQDISFITTANGLAYAYKTDGKKTALSQLISELEAGLDPLSFFRINRSEIVNAGCIKKVERYFNDRLAIFMSGSQEKLIVSASRTPLFRKWLNQL